MFQTRAIACKLLFERRLVAVNATINLLLLIKWLYIALRRSLKEAKIGGVHVWRIFGSMFFSVVSVEAPYAHIAVNWFSPGHEYCASSPSVFHTTGLYRLIFFHSFFLPYNRREGRVFSKRQVRDGQGYHFYYSSLSSPTPPHPLPLPLLRYNDEILPAPYWTTEGVSNHFIAGISMSSLNDWSPSVKFTQSSESKTKSY